MRKFLRTVSRNFRSLLVILALAYGISFTTALRWITDRLFNSRVVQSWIKTSDQLLSTYPLLSVLGLYIVEIKGKQYDPLHQKRADEVCGGQRDTD